MTMTLWNTPHGQKLTMATGIPKFSQRSCNQNGHFWSNFALYTGLVREFCLDNGQKSCSSYPLLSLIPPPPRLQILVHPLKSICSKVFIDEVKRAHLEPLMGVTLPSLMRLSREDLQPALCTTLPIAPLIPFLF